MNTIEHLLTCVAEESGEVVQVAGLLLASEYHAMRHGFAAADLEDCDKLLLEVNDLVAVLEMLRGHLSSDGVELFDEGLISIEQSKICRSPDSRADDFSRMIQIGCRLGQAAHKALRFGLDDGYPGTDRTNRRDLINEAHKLLAAMNLFVSKAMGQEKLIDRKLIETKKAKVKKFMGYAVERSCLTPS